MEAQVKAAVIAGVSAIIVTCLGWGLNHLTTTEAVGAIISVHKREITMERLHTELARFQGMAYGISNMAVALEKKSDESFFATKEVILREVSKYEAMSNLFPFFDWHRFSRAHVRNKALAGFAALSERKAKLPAEIRILCESLPETVVSDEAAKTNNVITSQIVAKLYELCEVHSRFWGMIESLTEVDLEPNQTLDPANP